MAHEALGALREAKLPLPKRLSRLFWFLVLPGVLASAPCLLAATALDSLYYGHWVLAPWNFLRFNLLHDGGAFYGSHAWHWYFTEGLAVTLGTFLPFTLWGAYLVAREPGRVGPLRGVLVASTLSVVALSQASHKEYRFLLPCLPPSSMLTAVGMERTARSWPGRRWRLCLVAIFLPQALAAVFFARVHQRGAEAKQNIYARIKNIHKIKINRKM